MSTGDSSGNWVTLLEGNERRGGTSAGRRTPPKDLVWKVALPEAVRSSPLLRDGVLFVTCRDFCTYALDGRTGKERWRFRAGAAVDSTPSISGRPSVSGATTARYTPSISHPAASMARRGRWARSGPRRWSETSRVCGIDGWDIQGHRPKQRTHPLEAPAARANLLDGVRGRSLVYFGCSDGRVYALESASGKDAWSYATDDSVIRLPLWWTVSW